MFLHLFVILFTVATEVGGTHPTGMHTCVQIASCFRFDTYLVSFSRTVNSIFIL